MPIPGVVFGRAKTAHEDQRRVLYSVFCGDIGGGFSIAHLKMFVFKNDSTAAKHYHPFGELFFLVQTEAQFDLVDVDNPAETATYLLQPLEFLLVPRRVAHRIHYSAGAVVIAGNSAPYVSPEHDDFQWDFGGFRAKEQFHSQ
ncbi:MAG: hypothetical protein ABSG68_08550 [Thermoguttaceae bacterium]|jgi:mannose-6-phosphate isomerase-like protein (cupin superfamily)